METIKTSQYFKMLPRVHLIGCRGGKWFLAQYWFKFGQYLSCQNLIFKIRFLKCCHRLSLCFVTIWVLELYHNLSFCCYLSFWVLLLFEFCHNVSFEFCHHLSFCVWSQIEFLSCKNLIFFCLVKVWVFMLSHFKFCLIYNLSFFLVFFSWWSFL